MLEIFMELDNMFSDVVAQLRSISSVIFGYHRPMSRYRGRYQGKLSWALWWGTYDIQWKLTGVIELFMYLFPFPCFIFRYWGFHPKILVVSIQYFWFHQSRSCDWVFFKQFTFFFFKLVLKSKKIIQRKNSSCFVKMF